MCDGADAPLRNTGLRDTGAGAYWKAATAKALWQRKRTTISASRPRKAGWTVAAGMACIQMTNPMRSFAAMTAWPIPTNTIPVSWQRTNGMAGCFKLQADDYKGWAKGLEQAGYATGGNYAASLIGIIERNGLDKYDRMVMKRCKHKVGHLARTGKATLPEEGKGYAFPLERLEFLLVTGAVRRTTQHHRCKQTMKPFWSRKTMARWWRWAAVNH